MRVVVISARVGGHWSAGHAIVEELSASLPADAEIELVDIFGRPYARRGFDAVAHFYETCTRKFPFVCSSLFVLTNGNKRLRFIEAFQKGNFSHRAIEDLLTPRPDLIVSDALNFGQLDVVQDVLSETGTHVPLVVVVTDPVTIHWGWQASNADRYLVGTELAADQVMSEFDVRPEDIHVTGLPVRAAFRQPRDKAAARRALGLDPNVFTALFMGGTSGAGNIEQFVGALQETDLPVHSIAIAGRNERLRRQLEETFDRNRVRAYGFVDNVHEFMQAADLLVTKAGPGTIVEALACGVPICISGHFPWTERGNTDYYVNRGCAMHVETPEELANRMHTILAGKDDAYEQLKAGAWETSRSEAAESLGRELAGMIGYGGRDVGVRAPTQSAGVLAASQQTNG